MIDYNAALFIDRYLYRNKQPGRKVHLLRAIRSLFFSSIKIPKEKNTDLVFFRSLNRTDYERLFNTIANCISEFSPLVIGNHIKETSKPNILAIFALARYVHLLFVFQASSLDERIYLFLRLCFYLEQLSRVKKLKPKYVVLFADMQPADNLIAQHFRFAGLKTITLQHGLYVDYGDYPTINVVNYQEQPSEYFLAWGYETEALINKYHSENKVVICGKPDIELVKRETDYSGDDYFTVILDQNPFEKQNIELLKIMGKYSKEHNINMNIRFHPGNNQKKYQQWVTYKMEMPIMNSKFVVGHTSSLIYELLIQGMPTYKYESCIPYVPLPDELLFKDQNQLHQKMSLKIDFASVGANYISYVSSESRKEYYKFFKKLLHEEI